MKKMLFMSFAAKLSTGSGKLQPATQFPAFFVDNCRKKFFQILPFDYMRAELLHLSYFCYCSLRNAIKLAQQHMAYCGKDGKNRTSNFPIG